MKGTLGELFCRALVDCLPTTHAKTILLMELAKWSGKTLYLPAQKRSNRRVEAARAMLANHQTPAEAALVIHERYGVTMRQAQRDVRAARG